MKVSSKPLGDVFTLVVLFLSTGAFLPLIVGTDLQGSEEGSPLTQIIWAVIYLIVIVRAVSSYRQILPLVGLNKCLCSLVALAILSALWSFDPSATVHHGIALLAITLFGVDFALRYSLREQLRLVCVVLGSVVVLSILAEIFLPGVLPQADSGSPAWHGVFGQKNTLGKIVVLAAAAFLSRPRYSRFAKLLIIALVVIAGAVVIASHSASSFVELLVMVIISQALGVLRWRPSALIITVFLSLLIAIPTFYGVINNFDAMTALVGRDSTLTGRTEVWRLAGQSIAARPLLGYGYDVFWEFSSQQATRIRDVIRWQAPSTHNGFMDLLLDVGAVGLLLFSITYIVTIRRAIALFRSDPTNVMVWPLLFLVEGLLCQITEASIVKPNLIYWLLYVSIAFSVSKRLLVESKVDRESLAPLPEPIPA
jgi:exopolysaccharide production protein ExoQ